MQEEGARKVETIVGLIAEVYRVYGSLRSLFSVPHSRLKMAPLEVLTLGAVVEQPNPLTVAQIGRLAGYSRQAIQRAANALVDAGLVEMIANPNHKRAQLLVATPEGHKVKIESEVALRMLSAALAEEFDLERVASLWTEVRILRESIDAKADGLIARLQQ